MATESAQSLIASIGQTAGLVWRTLDADGPMAFAQLVKATGQPRDNVMLALGWLAREDKVQMEAQGRSRIVSLRR